MGERNYPSSGKCDIVEPATITDDEWAYICAPQGMDSELYNLKSDPEQEHNIIDAHPDAAERMRNAWMTLLENHGASEPTQLTILAFRSDVNDAELCPP